MTMLKVENLDFVYPGLDSFSIKKINMEANVGEVVCVLGVSGSGKSTILNLISGIHHVKRGSISINGNIVSSVKDFIPIEKRAIAMSFQEPALFHGKNVLRNVIYGFGRGKYSYKNIMRAMRMIKEFDALSLARKLPNMLSAGQQQRVSLIRAMAADANLVMLDEPFANLDNTSKRLLREKILLLAKENKQAVILVTHDPNDALMMSDRIYIIHNGTILQHGTPADLYKNPASPFVLNMFGEFNEIALNVIDDKVITPFGIFNTSERKEQILLCIPFDAIRVDSTSNIECKILNSRDIGAHFLIKGVVEKHKITFFHTSMLNKGDVVKLSLNSSRMFIF